MSRVPGGEYSRPVQVGQEWEMEEKVCEIITTTITIVFVLGSWPEKFQSHESFLSVSLNRNIFYCS